MISNDVKSLDILVISLNVLHNYFESSTKLFSDSIYIAKFLDTSAKPIYIILRFLSGTSLCQSPLIDRSSSACSRPVTSEVMQVYTRVPFWVNTHGNAISDINISRDTNNLGTWPVYYTHAAECLGNHYPRRFIGRELLSA